MYKFEYFYPQYAHKNEKISPQINSKVLCNNPKITHSVDIINELDENYKLLQKKFLCTIPHIKNTAFSRSNTESQNQF